MNIDVHVWVDSTESFFCATPLYSGGTEVWLVEQIEFLICPLISFYRMFYGEDDEHVHDCGE